MRLRATPFFSAFSLVAGLGAAAWGCGNGSNDVPDASIPDSSVPPADVVELDGPDCGITACFRPIYCVTCCGGEEKYNGCCPCEPPWFDNIVCKEGQAPQDAQCE